MQHGGSLIKLAAQPPAGDSRSLLSSTGSCSLQQQQQQQQTAEQMSFAAS
jgi:hypothetical protein